jgi:hypothetical protein
LANYSKKIEIKTKSLLIFEKNMEDFKKSLENAKDLHSSNLSYEFFQFIFDNKDEVKDLLPSVKSGSVRKKILELIESENLANFFASMGNREYLEKAHEHGHEIDMQTSINAAKRGSSECFEYLIQETEYFPYSTMREEMAKNGHLDCLIFLHENGYRLHDGPYDTSTFYNVALSGSLECLIFLKEQNVPYCRHSPKVFAKNGNLECLKWLCENNYPVTHESIICAAENGHLECFTYLHDFIPSPTAWSYSWCNRIALRGHLQCLIFAHKNGYGRKDEDVCSFAVQNGHLECLKYAHAPEGDVTKGSPWNEQTCAIAALNGHLDCLIYAHENGCPWDEQTCANAALHGHFECLKYAVKNGCPWDHNTWHSATRDGHLDCLKYAVENGCPFDGYIEVTVDTCLRFAKGEVREYLLSL